MSTITIGIDPHKASHTAVAVDEFEYVVDEIRIRSCPTQAVLLREWADGAEPIAAVDDIRPLWQRPRPAKARVAEEFNRLCRPGSGSGKGDVMRSRAMMVVAMAGAIVLASVAPAEAHPIKPITCQIDFVLNGAIYEGPVTDCDYAGWSESFVIEATFPGPTPDVPFSGNTEHWVGATIIYTDTGVIVIAEKGVWSFNNRSDSLCSFDECLKYRTNGRVVEELTVGEETYVTEGYDELIGAKTHGMGYTPEFPPTGPSFGAEQSLRFN